jgi:hypothetical protein
MTSSKLCVNCVHCFKYIDVSLGSESIAPWKETELFICKAPQLYRKDLVRGEFLPLKNADCYRQRGEEDDPNFCGPQGRWFVARGVE